MVLYCYATPFYLLDCVTPIEKFQIGDRKNKIGMVKYIIVCRNFPMLGYICYYICKELEQISKVKFFC